MRGQTIFFYALVALNSTVYAIPLKVRTDNFVERPADFKVRELAGRVGFVDIGKEYVERRQDAIDA